MDYELNELIKDYSELAKKHSLPSFESLNDDFGIEKIDKKSLRLLRIVRKVIVEKVANSLNFLEIILNPVNVPRMYMVSIKSLKSEDIEEVKRIYGEFSEIVLEALEVEVKGYDEGSEVDMIKKTNDVWSKNKKSFSKIFGILRAPNSNNFKKDKSYFG